MSYPTRAFHTSELEYIFPLFHGGQGRPHALNAEQTKLANQIAVYWGTFARNGNPNHPSVPPWQAYAARADDVISLIEPKPHMTFGYGSQRYRNGNHNSCEVWDPIPLTGWTQLARSLDKLGDDNKRSNIRIGRSFDVIACG